MTDQTKPKPAPQVVLIRRPASPGAPVAPSPRPEPTVRPGGPPKPSRSLGRPQAESPRDRVPPPRSAAPLRAPTPEEIAALARKERVPNRIAKGELDGKMKCRIWKKLHAEEAKRFDQAWALVETTPELELADAFGIVQSGMTVEEFRARRTRARRREAIKEARSTVAAEPIDAFVASLIEHKTELSIVLGERTIIDALSGVAPVSFTGDRSGSLEKLQVVLLAKKSTWEGMLPRLEREPRLAQKPAQVPRQPARRAVSDPRLFLGAVGHPVELQLRNGIKLTAPLLAVGPFDVLVGTEGDEVFVPLHAMLSWAPVATN